MILERCVAHITNTNDGIQLIEYEEISKRDDIFSYYKPLSFANVSDDIVMRKTDRIVAMILQEKMPKNIRRRQH